MSSYHNLFCNVCLVKIALHVWLARIICTAVPTSTVFIYISYTYLFHIALRRGKGELNVFKMLQKCNVVCIIFVLHVGKVLFWVMKIERSQASAIFGCVISGFGKRWAKSINTLKICREKWINAFLLQQKAAKLAAAGLDIRDSVANLLDEGDADLLF